MFPCPPDSIPQIHHQGCHDAQVTSNDEETEFSCPRCSGSVRERFYGPCISCREELRELFAGSQNEVEAQRYEPKMNVTPNAVATKE